MYESVSLMTTLTKFKFIIFNVENNLQLLESTKSDMPLPMMLVGHKVKINSIRYEIVNVEHNFVNKKNQQLLLTVYNVIQV